MCGYFGGGRKLRNDLMPNVFAACTAAILGMIAVCSIPATSQAGDYGAVATADSNGSMGYSYNYDDEDGARERAIAECAKYASDCEVVEVFEDTCVTIVRNEVSGPGLVTWAEGGTKVSRQNDAMNECRNRGGTRCQVLQEFCTGDATDD